MEDLPWGSYVSQLGPHARTEGSCTFFRDPNERCGEGQLLRSGARLLAPGSLLHAGCGALSTVAACGCLQGCPWRGRGAAGSLWW